MTVIAKPRKGRPWPSIGSKRHRKEKQNLKTKHDYAIRPSLVAKSTAIKNNLKYTISISIYIKTLLDIEHPVLNLSNNYRMSLPAIHPPRTWAVGFETLRQTSLSVWQTDSCQIKYWPRTLQWNANFLLILRHAWCAKLSLIRNYPAREFGVFSTSHSGQPDSLLAGWKLEAVSPSFCHLNRSFFFPQL